MLRATTFRKSLLLDVRDDLGRQPAAALLHAYHDRLAGRAATTLAGPVAADVGLVKLNVTVEVAKPWLPP